MLKNSNTVTSHRKNLAEKVSKTALQLQLSMYNTKYLQLSIKTWELAEGLGIFPWTSGAQRPTLRPFLFPFC